MQGTISEHEEVLKLKISKTKLDLVLAKQCRTISELRHGVSPKTLQKARKGEDINPVVVGRIAKALDVDPTEIIETEE